MTVSLRPAAEPSRDLSHPSGALRLRPLHPLFGAEVEDIDLSRDGAVIPALRRALASHLVLVLRGQSLTPVQQVAVTALLGPVARHPLAALSLPGSPEVVVEDSGGDDRESRWHADLAWSATPASVSAVAAHEADGLTTEFATQVGAYERLDPWLRDRIEFLEAEHDHPRRAATGLPAVAHPLVRLDSGTGRRALLLDPSSAGRIRGLPAAESDDLLHRLHAAATHPALVWRHRWTAGDLLLWDNAALLHRTRRAAAGRLHRTMVRGEAPVGPAAVSMPWVSAG
ncbi:TauD/TfdA dioxygenase family protein [Falsiroseomonas sp. HW251]|uniref:TauD/TfdA dioxygenase family protein n=1 Tax=Falsiroseomonas sp. HW251 TaxID=3390998 RepID=UPI003D30FFCA